MEDGDGAVYIKICQGSNCCKTNKLDDPNVDDFELCETNDFSNEILGSCDGFEFLSDEEKFVTLIHEGTDGWLGEYAKISFSDQKQLHCSISGWIDDSQEKELSCLEGK